MKLVLILIVFTSLCFGQNNYEFDHAISYEITDLKDGSHNAIRTFLTNSMDNSYYAVINYMAKSKVQVIFWHRNKIHFNVEFRKKEFEEKRKLLIDCEYVLKFKNPHPEKIAHYQFLNKNDTLIEGTYFKQYSLFSDYDYKTRKKKKIGMNVYIIENQTEYHLPIFNYHTAYEKWKTGVSIPNGIFKQKLFINVNGDVTYKTRLRNFKKVKTVIIIPEGCEPD